MKHIFTSLAAMSATTSSAIEYSIINTGPATSKPQNLIQNPLSTVTPYPVSKFIEILYRSYANIFLFTLYIIVAVLGIGFGLWTMFTFLKKGMKRDTAEPRRQQQLRREKWGLADDLLRLLIGTVRARLDEEARLLGGEALDPNYGGTTTTTTILPRRRRPGVGEAEIGSPEDGTIAQRRSRRQGPSIPVARSATVVEAEEESEEEEVNGREEDGGEMR